MSWFYLGLAIVFEMAGTWSLKMAHGMTYLWPSIGIFVFYGISFTFASMAMKIISLSTAYAIWSGVGTALAATIGFTYFKEPVMLAKLVGISLIIIGVVVLRMVETT